MGKKNRRKCVKKPKEQIILPKKEIIPQIKQSLLDNTLLSNDMINTIYQYNDQSEQTLLKLYEKTSKCKVEVNTHQIPIYEKVIRAVQLGYIGIGYIRQQIPEVDIIDCIEKYNFLEHRHFNGYDIIILKNVKEVGTWINIFHLNYELVINNF